MKEKLNLEPGDTLRLDKSYQKGFMAETDVELYSVLDASGQVKGRVQFTEHTNVKAPHTVTCHVMQWDSDSKMIVDDRWVSK
jgi:uncharacterized protein YfaP (DUF2135 family)